MTSADTTAETIPTIVESPWPDPDLPDVSLTAFLLASAAQRSDHPAVVDAATGRSLTYGELAHQVGRIAAGFAAQRLHKGEVVAILAPNSPEWLVVCHGAIAAGGVVSGLNPLWSVDEVAAQIHDSAARFLVTVGALAATARAAATKAGVGTRLVLLDAREPADIDGALAYADLLACADPAPHVTIDPATDRALLPYSSGTTGLAKGVMLTHRACIANVVQMLAVLRVGPADRTLAVAPFSHAVGWGVVANCALRNGATIVTLPRFEPHAFLGAIQQHRITQTVVVPPVVLALCRHPAVADYDLSSLAWLACGAAPLGADLQRECMARLGIPVVQGFGMTEAVATIAADRIDGPITAGSCGHLLPGVQGRIDPTTGELWIRSPAVMAGYLGRPDATAATVDAEGWLHTGDIAHFAENGALFVVDRIKELIKVKGFQVAPAELEAVLCAHPAVADAAVIGIPDERSGEVPKAFVVARTPVSADELTAHLAAHVAPYKQVREIEFIDAVPVSPTGKILRRLLRSLPAAFTALPHPRTVHLTLGTVFTTPEVLATALTGLRDLAVNVVVTTWDNTLPPQPAHVLVARYLPHALLLPHCDLVVSQGGAGILLGTLANGLPQLVLPQGADQPANAAAVQRAGAGLALSDVTAERVRGAAAQLLSDPGYAARARELSAEIAAMPHADTVVRQL